jgi:hypothetical protein
MNPYWMSNTIKVLVGATVAVVGSAGLFIMRQKRRNRQTIVQPKKEDYGTPVSPV